MAGNEKNFSYFTYVDDSGTSWNLRGESGGAATGIDGHAASVATQPVFIRRPGNTPRRIRYQEPTTGRSAFPVFYTGAAYAAVALGSTMNVQLQGDATAVAFTAVQKLGEKRRGTPAFSRHYADI